MTEKWRETEKDSLTGGWIEKQEEREGERGTERAERPVQVNGFCPSPSDNLSLLNHGEYK